VWGRHLAFLTVRALLSGLDEVDAASDGLRPSFEVRRERPLSAPHTEQTPNASVTLTTPSRVAADWSSGSSPVGETRG
jgi:hypothetical protein